MARNSSDQSYVLPGRALKGRDKGGMFQPGNQLWRLGKPGRPRLFNNPDEIWDAAVAYFEWVQATPLHEEKAFQKGKKKSLNKMRAMTIEGLSTHMGITKPTWENYRKRPEFKEICGLVEAIMFEWSFTGAAAGLLNPIIVQAKLAIANKSEVAGPGGEPLIPETSVLELGRRLAFILASAQVEQHKDKTHAGSTEDHGIAYRDDFERNGDHGRD